MHRRAAVIVLGRAMITAAHLIVAPVEPPLLVALS